MLLAERIFKLLLLAYPSEFRREYEREMVIVFRDCLRSESQQNGNSGILRLICSSFGDVILTSVKERFQAAQKGGKFMKPVRTIVIALLAYVAVFALVVPFFMKMRGQMPFFVGSLFDAFISIGLGFSFIFLVLVLPRFLEPIRAVYATGIGIASLLILSFILFTVLLPPEGRPNLTVLLAQFLSFVFWFAVHFLWANKISNTQATA